MFVLKQSYFKIFFETDANHTDKILKDMNKKNTGKKKITKKVGK